MNIQKCKLQKQSTDGTISVTVPKKFIKILGWKPQDIVTFVLEGFQIKMFKDEEDVQQTAKGSDSEIKG